MSEDNRCIFCKYHAYNRCRRNAPRVHGYDDCAYPNVDERHWCGEFEMKEEYIPRRSLFRHKLSGAIKDDLDIYITKEELITLSESWSENEEITVRKILQQGGKCKIGNDIISVKREDPIYSLARY